MADFRKKLEAGRCPPSNLCALGHDQAAYYKHTGGPCPCVDAQIPKAGVGHHNIRSSFFGDFAPSPEDELIERESKDQLERALNEEEGELLPDVERLRKRLRLARLSTRNCKLVELRVVNRMTFEEIALELSYASRSAAHSSYRSAIQKLRRTMNVVKK